MAKQPYERNKAQLRAQIRAATPKSGQQQAVTNRWRKYGKNLDSKWRSRFGDSGIYYAPKFKVQKKRST